MTFGKKRNKYRQLRVQMAWNLQRGWKIWQLCGEGKDERGGKKKTQCRPDWVGRARSEGSLLYLTSQAPQIQEHPLKTHAFTPVLVKLLREVAKILISRCDRSLWTLNEANWCPRLYCEYKIAFEGNTNRRNVKSN